jgi:hypothetical protein
MLLNRMALTRVAGICGSRGYGEIVMAENVANQIARHLYAMSAKKRETNLVDALRNEKYQRTFTDEQFPQKPRAGFKPLDAEQKRHWKALMGRGETTTMTTTTVEESKA